jgi:hypothetical protein
MEETKELPTYAERMEAFPDVNEDLENYRVQEMQKNFARFMAMMKALNMGRTHHVRVNSWKRPEPHRADGSPMTKRSRASRAEVSRRKSKAARHARALNR